MPLLRVLLALWLSLPVSTAALASVVNAGHCQPGKATASAMPTHARHAMHADRQVQGAHAPHRAHSGKLTKTDNSGCGCGCGCNCSGTHCASGCSGVMATSGPRDAFIQGLDSRLAFFGPTRPVAAHHLDLLRPPSLS